MPIVDHFNQLAIACFIHKEQLDVSSRRGKKRGAEGEVSAPRFSEKVKG